LDRSQKAVFQIPPAAWIEDRLVTFQAVLERKTEKAAMLLRKLRGPIRLEPVQPEVGRPYYRAVSTLDAPAIIEEEPEGGPSEPGSNTLRKWAGEIALLPQLVDSLSLMVGASNVLPPKVVPTVCMLLPRCSLPNRP
jgi:hypothetical protein